MVIILSIICFVVRPTQTMRICWPTFSHVIYLLLLKLCFKCVLLANVDSLLHKITFHLPLDIIGLVETSGYNKRSLLIKCSNQINDFVNFLLPFLFSFLPRHLLNDNYNFLVQGFIVEDIRDLKTKIFKHNLPNRSDNIIIHLVT